MLAKLKLPAYFLLLAVLVIACSEDGDPGQDAEGVYRKSGFFEGTVSGIKKDGTLSANLSSMNTPTIALSISL